MVWGIEEKHGAPVPKTESATRTIPPKETRDTYTILVVGGGGTSDVGGVTKRVLLHEKGLRLAMCRCRTYTSHGLISSKNCPITEEGGEESRSDEMRGKERET